MHRFHSRYVLMICYDFPGIYAAGVIRTYQLAKRLPSFGWQSVILTAQGCSVNQEHNIETSDGQLNCPKITVPPSRVFVPFLTDHHVPSNPRGGMKPQRKKGAKRLVQFATQLGVPDGKIGWLLPAVRRGLQIARDYPIGMCFSVSPRPSSHLVAQRLARRLDIPWVADFSLPWSDAYWLSNRPRVIGWLDQQLEGSVVRSADHITVAYPDIARSIRGRFSIGWQEKISVIPTGFNEDLFDRKIPPTSSKVTVVYPGNHFCEEGRHGEYFLKAIDELVSLDPGLGDKLEFVFMGKRDDELLRQRASMAHPEVIRVEPMASHRVCTGAILSAHMCVVNTVGNRIPAKVYECMAAEKWILALSEPDSDLEQVIRHYRRGISIPPQDTSAIRIALQNLLQGSRSGQLERIDADPSMAKYCSEHSAQLLSRIFDNLLRVQSGCDCLGPRS